MAALAKHPQPEVARLAGSITDKWSAMAGDEALFCPSAYDYDAAAGAPEGEAESEEQGPRGRLSPGRWFETATPVGTLPMGTSDICIALALSFAALCSLLSQGAAYGNGDCGGREGSHSGSASRLTAPAPAGGGAYVRRLQR